MNIKGVKDAIYALTKQYFKDSSVIFGKQSHLAKPSTKPLVTIFTTNVNRPTNPPTRIINGNPVSFYPTTLTVQIDLFTKGQTKELSDGYTVATENTATDEMMSFINFLNSPYAVQYCHKLDIALLVPDVVQDLTGLINDTSYEYRAMIEVTVYFTSVAAGFDGTLADWSSDTGEYFTNVEINDKLVKEEE